MMESHGQYIARTKFLSGTTSPQESVPENAQPPGDPRAIPKIGRISNLSRCTRRLEYGCDWRAAVDSQFRQEGNQEGQTSLGISLSFHGRDSISIPYLGVFHRSGRR